MELKVYSDAGTFLAAARVFLDKHPAANHNIVATALQLKNDDDTNGAFFTAILDEDRIIVAAVRNPPQHVMISYFDAKAVPRKAMEILVHHVTTSYAPLSGVLGTPGDVDLFCKLYAQKMRMSSHAHRKMCCHQLTKVRPPRPCRGILRPATDRDEELILDWTVAFEAEIGDPHGRSEIRETAIKRLDAHDYYFWEDSHAVSMAVRTRPTDKGICISKVYTPPEYRNRGYASACVAALSQKLLDNGYTYCSLYTDVGNPTSNHIYGAIGYVPVCDAINIEFHAL